MKTKKLGNSDLKITRVGLGAWAIGGAWQFGWGQQDDDDSIATIHKALDAGMNWIDTAPAYGLGHSEEIVGKAVKGLSEKPYIFTKCSLVWDEPIKERTVYNSLKADSIRREVEGSLRRLQVEAIDLYQIHWPNPEVDIEEGWETLLELKKAGKVRWIAVSNFNVAQMEKIGQLAPTTSLQPPYSAIKRSVETEILPYCEKNDIGVIVYSPMQAGMLTGKMSRERIAEMPKDDWRIAHSSDYREPALTRNLAIQDLFIKVAEEQNVPTPTVAVAWVLKHTAVTAAIVGARRPSQVDGIAPALSYEMDDETYQRINQFLSSDAA